MKNLKFEGESREQEKRYNPNNEGIISVFRHGEKNHDGSLSESGFEQARKIGEKTERVGRIVKDYGSPMKRTQDMAREMSENLVQKEVVNLDTGEPIKGEKYQSRVRNEFSWMVKGKTGQFMEKDWFELAKEYPEKPLEVYLNFGEKRPDPDTLSPKEMASRVAKVLFDQIRMIGRLKPGSKVNLADASHTPVLDIFVLIAFKDQIEQDPINPEGKTLVEKMGGMFKTADGFEVKAKTDSEGNLSAKVFFRGKKYNIDLNDFEKLANFYKEEKQES